MAEEARCCIDRAPALTPDCRSPRERRSPGPVDRGPAPDPRRPVQRRGDSAAWRSRRGRWCSIDVEGLVPDRNPAMEPHPHCRGLDRPSEVRVATAPLALEAHLDAAHPSPPLAVSANGSFTGGRRCGADLELAGYAVDIAWLCQELPEIAHIPWAGSEPNAGGSWSEMPKPTVGASATRAASCRLIASG